LSLAQRQVFSAHGPGRSRAAWLRWQVWVFFAGLLLALAALVGRPLLQAPRATPGEVLQRCEAALEADDMAQASKLAQQAVELAGRSHTPAGLGLLALGLVRERQGDTALAAERAGHYGAAAQHFYEAARAGLPPDQRAKLIFHLARCVLLEGRAAEAIALLRQSAETRSPYQIDSLQLLTQAYLDPSCLDLDRALRTNSELVRMSGLSGAQMAEAWRARADILQRTGRLNPLLGLARSGTAEELKWLSVLVRAQESAGNKRYDESAMLYRDLAACKGLPPAIERRTWYLIGYTARERGDLDSALASFRTVEWRYPNTDESRAAAAHSAGILLHRGETAAAVAAFQRAVRQQIPADQPCVVLGDASLAALIARAVEHLHKQGQYRPALELVESYRAVGPDATADRATAELHEAWANAELNQGNSGDMLEATRGRYEALEHLRLAGSLFVRVADAAESDGQAAELLWRAAQTLYRGESYLAAFQATERLLATGQLGDVRPNALALACAALEGSGSPQQVPRFAEACIREFPEHSASVAARLHLAKWLIASRQSERAESYLRANLAALAREANEQLAEQSRLMLAKLLYDQGRDQEAIARLEEILGGAGERDVVVEARLLLADCFRLRARTPAGRLAEVNSEAAKLHYRRTRDQYLEQALDQLGLVQRDLFDLEQADRASPTQLVWLRKARWAIADCLYQLDRIQEASSVYQTLAGIYEEPSDWLEAQLQIASCHARLNRLEAARAVLRDAQARVQQMPPEAAQAARSALARSPWRDWLEPINR
jgi:hypothetical protein